MTLSLPFKSSLTLTLTVLLAYLTTRQTDSRVPGTSLKTKLHRSPKHHGTRLTRYSGPRAHLLASRMTPMVLKAPCLERRTVLGISLLRSKRPATYQELLPLWMTILIWRMRLMIFTMMMMMRVTTQTRERGTRHGVAMTIKHWHQVRQEERHLKCFRPH